MSLTAAVKDELARVRVDRISSRKAEVAATLRFAGGLHIISGRIVIEAELDNAAAAHRLRAAIHEVYGHKSDIIVVSGGALRRGNRYVVRVVREGEALARQTGLLDARGRPVRGLPPQVVSASVGDTVAAQVDHEARGRTMRNVRTHAHRPPCHPGRRSPRAGVLGRRQRRGEPAGVVKGLQRRQAQLLPVL